MHLTLHLTSRCNLRCRYCYASPHEGGDMPVETAIAAVDLAVRSQPLDARDDSLGIVFFGGEPLLRRDLILEIIRYCGRLRQQAGHSFYFKITTNGTLLDESFLTDSLTSEVFVALSHDGVPAAHDYHRVDLAGTGTFRTLETKVELLLRYKPYAPVLLVTTPETVENYAASVEYLYRCGFRYLICSLNYGAAWSRRSLTVLKRQYDRLATWYEALTLKEQKFYFSPFDTKIAAHIFPGSCRRERCELGQRQISVAPSGRLYPCVQFVGDGTGTLFAIGDVWRGVDEDRRAALYRQNAEEKASCADCQIRERCNHFCGCLNKQATGSIDAVSPVLCANEQMTLSAADRVAERLYRRRSPMFVQKQYNELYPLVSLAEDQSSRHPVFDHR